MASDQVRPFVCHLLVSLLLVLNFCMYAILLGIGGWAMNQAIDHDFILGTCQWRI
ncbi:hypothetical protein HanRHA438_Chr04g0183221 [Helianthus annuus]|nr:hypothetical protein HanOQP8_Chr04g0154161 [Helianthus annuus]KAJ0927469.1 hypothetical protein HanRHA438_Chr04g0183221 [Helianthus annuus]